MATRNDNEVFRNPVGSQEIARNAKLPTEFEGVRMHPSDTPGSPWIRKTTRRIPALRDGKIQPIFDQQPLGQPSPSPTLLVERFDLPASDWRNHILPDQMLALFVKPAVLQRSLRDDDLSEIPLAAGQASFPLRAQPVNMRWDRPISVLCVRVADSMLQRAQIDLSNRHTEILPAAHVTDSRLTSLLTGLEAERALGYPSGRLFIDSIEAALATLLVRSFNAASPKAIMDKDGLHPRHLRRVLDYMHENIQCPVTLEDLAACCCLSVSHFSHLFRISTRKSPHQYLLQLRVEHCKQLLRNPDLSILEVALAAGFQNQQHFATVFRRLTGVTPSAYRYQS
jgi:AraC family transcriptional regulator